MRSLVTTPALQITMDKVLCLCFITLSVVLVQGAYPGYNVDSISRTATGYKGSLTLKSPGPYGSDVQKLNLEATYYSQQILRLRLTDASADRWEVPWVVDINPPATAPTNPDLTLAFPSTGSQFGFQVIRTANKDVLFDTTAPSFDGLIYEDLYLELSTSLPNNANIYGIGERITSFRLPPNTYTLWAKDHGTPLVQNLESGNAHGVFLLNSNALDVILGSNKLTYKVTGGIIDLWFFSGPSPNAVVQQYNQVIGNPALPAYWHLGWHQCRWGYGSVQQTADVVANYAKNNIPLDTIWNDIDYMDNYKDFTLSSSFPPAQMQQFLNQLHTNGQHYVPIIDPGIANQGGYAPYTTGLQQDVFVKAAAGQPIVGQVWPGNTVFPDFLNLKTHDWWYQQLNQFHTTGMPFDGLWIDMNEPSNFCNGQCANAEEAAFHLVKGKAQYDPNNPPYTPGGGSLSQSTLNVTATQQLDGKKVIMYNTHNLYGWSEGIATKSALEKIRNKRALVISRSTYPGSGSRHGHWLGDNYAHWDNLYYSISGTLSMQLFGIPLVGADICGFNDDTTEELCSRWMQLGTLYPFSRNHNTRGARSQEPYAFGPILLNASRISLNLRYSLLPYYYSQFYNLHTSGGALWRPLFFEFPTDSATFAIDRSFLVGPALLVSPILDQGATTVQQYFPAEYWFNYFSGAPVGNPKQATTLTLQSPISSPINIHIRGGYIVPTQKGALTTTASRLTPFTIIVALNPEGAGYATGDLFLDDGDSLDSVTNKNYTLVKFSAKNTGFAAEVGATSWAGASILTYEAVVVYGVPSAVTSVKLNTQTLTTFTFDNALKKLTVNLPTGTSLSKSFSLSWGTSR